jgi:hypothetical protein
MVETKMTLFYISICNFYANKITAQTETISRSDFNVCRKTWPQEAGKFCTGSYVYFIERLLCTGTTHAGDETTLRCHRFKR